MTQCKTITRPSARRELFRRGAYSITTFPRMQQIAEGYGWMNFNQMIGVCNISWVQEFYANALGRDDDDYTSYVRGVEISYAPDVIDTVFGFRPEEHCMVIQRRTSGHTEAEYAEMLQGARISPKFVTCVNLRLPAV
ncbi:hypothetical protein A2U01_0021918 [Trifolium medium]|uniref:Putative plant transposon protein domain-containing protein n=1 Tax=Trifolium medium TaxID=97028 RepID=A0A392NND5_9FABA|nr:hypothetical protein [Trifolium medium]